MPNFTHIIITWGFTRSFFILRKLMMFFIVEIKWEASEDHQRGLHLILAWGNNSSEGNEMGVQMWRRLGKAAAIAVLYGVTAGSAETSRGSSLSQPLPCVYFRSSPSSCPEHIPLSYCPFLRPCWDLQRYFKGQPEVNTAAASAEQRVCAGPSPLAQAQKWWKLDQILGLSIPCCFPPRSCV